ncbi:hypothetical protein [Fundidesulfovibrio putealis]|uniref:hypothetical protein n=1 Tax=Fundidesulfovibrio putealis TaxID=270496 RepID=UPI00047F7D9B|nr:hypothetical protein [Fundidesulfovibrio putealis]
MDDDLTYKLVNALKHHADQPQQSAAGISIRNLTINVGGDVHIHSPHDRQPTSKQKDTRRTVSRREMIEAIHANAGRYFHKNQFSDVLMDLFGVCDLNTASLKVVRRIWEWAMEWQREVVTGTDD